ncbi:MAG TPA: J domain-containing protein, partial [Pyrinomonadaceae bacterium]|nr:J domain-containing protein [Pyrinomonadaceae bacterium]
PGVSERELKAAHRDLAKVWHPDRFLHDPRLQDKAQEKLKEINEAYEQLTSGKVPKAPPKPPPPAPVTVSQPVTPVSRGFGSMGIGFLMFMAVFAITIGVLLKNPPSHIQIPPEPTEEVSTSEPVRSRAKHNFEPNKVEIPSATPEATPVEPLATVTVVIDPKTGLLATTDCPLRSRMTYPTGSEPHSYCNAQHPPKTGF